MKCDHLLHFTYAYKNRLKTGLPTNGDADRVNGAFPFNRGCQMLPPNKKGHALLRALFEKETRPARGRGVWNQ